MADYTILLIDYEPRSVGRTRNALEKAGFRVVVAADGEAGLKAFDESFPVLTLVEAMLPKLHGFEVCRRLKETPHGQTSPVVILTSVYKGRRYRSEAKYRYRCDGYLEKPISDEQLVEAVRSFLREAKPAAPLTSAVAPEPSVEEQEILDHLDTVLGDDGDGPAPVPRRSRTKPEV